MSALLFFTLCLVALSVVYYFDTPKKKDKPKEISSADIALAVTRAAKCKCNAIYACPPCSDRLDRVDQIIQQEVKMR